MVAHLRRFVTLPIFEFEFASESRAPPPLAAAAKCLALCIKVILSTSGLRAPSDINRLSWLQAMTLSCLTCIPCSIMLLRLAKTYMKAQATLNYMDIFTLVMSRPPYTIQNLVCEV